MMPVGFPSTINTFTKSPTCTNNLHLIDSIPPILSFYKAKHTVGMVVKFYYNAHLGHWLADSVRDDVAI
jgi:hypothetical protein